MMNINYEGNRNPVEKVMGVLLIGMKGKVDCESNIKGKMQTVSRKQFLKMAGYSKAVVILNKKRKFTKMQKLMLDNAIKDEKKLSNQIATKINAFCTKEKLDCHFDNKEHNKITLYISDAAANIIKKKANKKQEKVTKTNIVRISSIATADGVSKPMQRKMQKLSKNYIGIETFTEEMLTKQLS